MNKADIMQLAAVALEIEKLFSDRKFTPSQTLSNDKHLRIEFNNKNKTQHKTKHC